MPPVYNAAINRKEDLTMANKLADNKTRICITMRKDLARDGKSLAEKEGLTFTALLSHLLAVALNKKEK